MEIKPNKIPCLDKKLSKELIDQLVLDIKNGSTNKRAARANGITEAIFYAWQQQGVVDIHYGVQSLKAFLVESLARVEQEEIQQCRNVIRPAAEGHKGAQWTLEQVYWRDFSGNAPAIELSERIDRLEIQDKETQDALAKIKE
jgi:hypothetical protein